MSHPDDYTDLLRSTRRERMPDELISGADLHLAEARRVRARGDDERAHCAAQRAHQQRAWKLILGIACLELAAGIWLLYQWAG